VSKRLNLS